MMCRRVDVDRDLIWMCVSQWLRLFSADQNREFRLSSFGCTAQHVKHSADGMLVEYRPSRRTGAIWKSCLCNRERWTLDSKRKKQGMLPRVFGNA